MKTLKRVALIMLSVLMLFSMSAFAADSPVKSTFNASLKKTSVTYNGKTQKPSVKVTDIKGKTIAKKYYTVSVGKCKDAGKYTVTIKGKGKYAGYVEKLTYNISKKSQNVTVNKKNVTVKYSKKKAKTAKINVKKKAGKVTYTTNSSKIKVSSNGKITVKKGTKKGVYRVTIKVTAKNYKTVTKQISVTVK